MKNPHPLIEFREALTARSRPLDARWLGLLRAEVVETDDPLQMHRVRFRCPVLHDAQMPAYHCPWAIPAPWLGGYRSKQWAHPCIGDWVWISFEHNHPYGPVWVGFADPTRRKLYAYPSLFGSTPLPVDENGKPAAQPDDFQRDYLPKDMRPMSMGVQDRYGNLDLSSAVGFFPKEHAKQPPDPDNDALQALALGGSDSRTPFKQSKSQPEMNKPDGKFMVRMTKYGSYLILADQGYIWKKDGATGEFLGDFQKDEQWEIKRWKYIQQLLSEGKPDSRDQRRVELRTRYGHKLEMRDVGWSKSRQGEYDDQRELASQQTGDTDQRWIKMRTKGGMIIQAWDKGFDPVEDTFVKRKLIEEVGCLTEQEDAWPEADARMIRAVTRHGFKIVLDDRGSDTKQADEKETPRGYGILIKGRRSPGSSGSSGTDTGDQRGFFLEINEKDEVNATTWGSPAGLTIQLNDRQQYLMLAGRKAGYSRPWKKFLDNEFLTAELAADDLESKSYHLKFDLSYEYLRLKTRSGKGDGPLGSPTNPPGVKGSEPQGLECRDGSEDDDPWVELVDNERRGLWFWGKNGLIVCRAAQGSDSQGFAPKKLAWWINEQDNSLVIWNAEKISAGTSGSLADVGKFAVGAYVSPPPVIPRIQIYCRADVEIIAERRVNILAAESVTIRGGSNVVLTAGGTSLEVRGGQVRSTVPIRAPDFIKMPVSVFPDAEPEKVKPPQWEPKNRGQHSPNVAGA